MRGLIWGLPIFAALGLSASGAAQPADCPAYAAPGPSQGLAVDLAGRPGVPAGVKGEVFVTTPMQTPQTDCGEPSAPSDVLGGPPGDLLRGAPSPTQAGR
jgi:hypothetical protein